MRAVFGKVRPIDDEHSILLTQCLVHPTLMLGYERLVVPTALPDELGPRPHLPLRMRPHPEQAQGHGFNVLAGDISREQSAQIDRCPLPLFASVEERGKVLVVGCQLLGQSDCFFRRQSLDSPQVLSMRQICSDITQCRHNVSPPGRNFPSVYPKSLVVILVLPASYEYLLPNATILDSRSQKDYNGQH